MGTNHNYVVFRGKPNKPKKTESWYALMGFKYLDIFAVFLNIHKLHLVLSYTQSCKWCRHFFVEIHDFAGSTNKGKYEKFKQMTTEREKTKLGQNLSLQNSVEISVI